MQNVLQISIMNRNKKKNQKVSKSTSYGVGLHPFSYSFMFGVIVISLFVDPNTIEENNFSDKNVAQQIGNSV